MPDVAVQGEGRIAVCRSTVQQEHTGRHVGCCPEYRCCWVAVFAHTCDFRYRILRFSDGIRQAVCEERVHVGNGAVTARRTGVPERHVRVQLEAEPGWFSAVVVACMTAVLGALTTQLTLVDVRDCCSVQPAQVRDSIRDRDSFTIGAAGSGAAHRGIHRYLGTRLASHCTAALAVSHKFKRRRSTCFRWR